MANNRINSSGASCIKLLNLAHSNAQSIEPHLSDLTSFAKNNDLHVLGISESFLKPENASGRVAIPNYTLFRVDRIGKACGGVAIYVHESIKAKEVCRSAQPSVYAKRPEFLFLELSTGNCRILCGTVYSPPKAGFWGDVEEAIFNCNSAYDFTVIMGDFNVEWHTKSSSRTTLSDSLSSCLLEPLPFAPTHHLDNSSSTIDYVCVSDVSKVKSSKQVHIPSISKHDLLLVTLFFEVVYAAPATVKRRDYRNCRVEGLLDELVQLDWSEFYASQEVDVKVRFFTNALVQLYDKHAPYRNSTPRRKHSPWMNPSLRNLISRRNKAWRDHKRELSEASRCRYNRLRNQVQTSIRDAKFAYFQSKLDSCENSKELWRTIRHLGVNSGAEVQRMPDDPEAFNAYFVATPVSHPGRAIPSSVRPPLEEQFFFKYVEVEDVLEAFASAHSNALGVDTISLRHLTECLPAIMHALLDIFDCSLQSGVFPSDWKRAIARPIPKRTPALRIEDFRLVSILCSASKILERVALDQINIFISEKKLIGDFQSGFRRNHSTHTALVRIIDDVRLGIDGGLVTLFVGIDFSQAFDLIDVDVLIMKLRGMGFSDAAAAWVFSFLTGRSQFVAFSDGAASSPLERYKGVPQGSLLGPPFFSLFIDDLPKVLEHCKYHLYADDLVIYIRGRPAEAADMIERINSDLTAILRWASDNRLIVNAKKTQALWIGSRGFMTQLREASLPPIVMGDVPVTPGDTLKLLGVTLDSTLSWREHCNVTARKFFGALARLRKCQMFLPAGTKLMLIKTLAFPLLEYCPGVMLDLSKELKTKMSRCKNAAVRFATGVKVWEHISPTYRRLDILDYSLRSDFLVLCLLASILRNGSPNYLSEELNFVPVDRPGGRHRSEFDINIASFNTEYRRHSFCIGTAYKWNALPHDLRASYARPCFKWKLYKYLLGTADSSSR